VNLSQKHMPPDQAESRFDYIIVGGGSAGCVLANRLTADGRSSVLLIEAGGDDRPFHNLRQFAATQLIHIPAAVAFAMRHPGLTWGFSSEPEPSVDGRSFDVVRGRVLGGSSSINGMFYVRGEKQDYDRWAAAGCAGWNWDAVLPYFIRAEHHETATGEWQGTAGPLHISRTTPYPIMDAVLEAVAESDLPRSADLDRGTQFGVGSSHVTIRNGRRHSAAGAYLHPARGRSKLSVVTNTLVTKILFEGRTAVGVEVDRDGRHGRYYANNEIIVSAGAIGSPQLLEVSGIGDGRRLQALDVPVIVDAPGIGENLQDHYFVPLSWRLKPSVRTINGLARFPHNLYELAKYVFGRRGLLGQAAAQLFIYAKSGPQVETADLQLSVVPATMPQFNGRKIVPDPFPGLMIASAQLRPASRGHVHARSSDVRMHPSIQHRYLSDPLDQATQLAGMRLVRAIAGRGHLAQHIEAELTPGADLTTDEALLDYARRDGGSVYHPVGTVRMGNDAGAPLDPRLRVKGVDRLRVVDASIMPFLTSGNTHAPTIMIAEKASDMILDDRR
jgi:choline dehydrogenase